MNNALDPSRMTPAERLDEIAGILAAGIRRLRTRETSYEFKELGDFRLDFSPAESTHGPEKNRKGGGSRT